MQVFNAAFFVWSLFDGQGGGLWEDVGSYFL